MGAPSPLRTPPLPPLLYEDLVRAALREDLGRAGDLTSDAIVPPDQRATATLRARRAGCVAGLPIAACAFRLLDPDVVVDHRVADGADVAPGTDLAVVTGDARAVLAAERTALNLLGRLSGIATATRTLTRAIEGTGARIACTRKTTPLLRALEKYAVRAAGGANHRFGLDDAILIKDNHRALAGGAAAAVARARAHAGHLVKIELEVDDLDELDAVCALGIDAVLLDNMPPETLRRAVAIVAGRCITEASGGITPETVRSLAETGVDLLSVGYLTHSAPVFDIGLDIDLDPAIGVRRHRPGDAERRAVVGS
ncbi:MAG: carboxylating nicotinate-nucleotide diphosphorylase [Acidobacteriota bacterium]